MEKYIKTPTVSVVMSVFNGEAYLTEAIDSILAQTFDDFELIIIDDGSTDKSNEIIRHYKDKRIRLLEQENRGLVESLNRGILEAKGKYIARHDADDASLPSRFKKQIKLLESNTELVIVGSSMSVMNEKSIIKHEHHVLLNDPELRQELLIRSPFAHGSVMFIKSKAIKAGLYEKSYWPAEDYEFWLRLSKHGLLANIDEPLYIYRENEIGISARNQKIQNEKVTEIKIMAWAQRRRLVKGRISLSKYEGDERVKRIIDNLRYGIITDKKKNNSAHTLRMAKAIGLEPEVYRKLISKIKRKVVK